MRKVETVKTIAAVAKRGDCRPDTAFAGLCDER